MDYLDYLSLKEMENQILEPPEDKIYCYCNNCGGEIYEGEDCYDVGEPLSGENLICEKCFDEKQSQEKEDCRRIAGDNDGD